MAKNILIDNNIWLKLVSDLGDDRNLPILEDWSKTKQILIFCPEALKREWEKHKAIKASKFFETVEDLAKQIRISRVFGNIYNPGIGKQKYAEKFLSRQIEIIDGIFKRAMYMHEEDSILQVVKSARQNRKAPFHKKGTEAQQNDAYIIYSTLEYLRANGDTNLIFVTDNYRDFSDPINPSQLHKDLVNSYQGIEIKYFRTLNDAIAELVAEGLAISTNNSYTNENRVKNDVQLNPEDHLVDQLHTLLCIKFENVNFLPKRFFAHQFPFILGETYNYSDKAFTITTDNESLYILLTSLSYENGTLSGFENIDTQKCENAHEKLLKIFDILSFNHIHSLQYKIEKTGRIPFIPRDMSKMFINQLRELQWENVFPTLESTDQQDWSTKLNQGYALYKLRDYAESAIAYNDVLTKLKQENNHSKAAIVGFSVSILPNYIRSRYFNELAIPDLLKQLEISLPKLLVKAQPGDQNLIEWLYSDDFLSGTEQRIHQLTSNIRLDFFTTNGGWNTYTLELINLYIEIESFVTYNQISYDSLSEFSILTKIFIEGIMASHGCKASLRGKITTFEDWLLEILLWQADYKDLKHYFTFYKLNRLESDQNTVDIFTDRITGLLKNHNDYYSRQIKWNRHPKSYDNHPYTSLVSNGVTLLAILPIAQNKLDAFSLVLISFLKKLNEKPSPTILDCIAFFFTRQIEFVSEFAFQEIYKSLLLIESFDSESLISSISPFIESHKGKFRFSNEEFLAFKTIYLISDLNSAPASSKLDTIGETYAMLEDPRQRLEISRFFDDLLKLRFDPSTFYMAAMYNIIPFCKQLSQQYIASFETSLVIRPKLLSFFGKDYYTDHRVDYFLNYCWKYNLEISTDNFRMISALGPYYEWLLDLDGCDYTRFKPNWLTHHFVYYCRIHLRKSKKLKEALSREIKNMHDEYLLKVTIAILRGD